MSLINRLLVANRGEIAARVFATCHRLGIETVAVYSEADAGLPFVAAADFAVPLEGNAPAETYLRGDLIIEAARRSGADAIHPGYGFLSENADFARMVAEAGLTWIGPTPESIEEMGSKIEAKGLMKAAGVPILEAPEQPTQGDLPLLIKASAGGGGRGMRVVRDLAELAAEHERAIKEAESAFGDGTVFVEPYVERSRHVEVQIVADQQGSVRVFGTRDCSLQRRHQKVVEEAPAPSISAETREQMHTAAAAAARSCGYVGAGTVELLYDATKDSFYFLEMNTRLQVEHPVTELVYGVDLVELQIGVAEGRSLDELLPTDPEPHGHAIEARLYAEDPANDYQPQSGLLDTFEFGVAVAFGPSAGLRVDAGYGSGDTVSTFYDAMLAKVIVWAPTRDQANRRLGAALRQARIHGLVTNRDQVAAALQHPDFVSAQMSTALLDEPLGEATGGMRLASFAAAIALAEHDRARRQVQHQIPVAWRNVASQPQRTELLPQGAESPIVVSWYGGRDGYRLDDVTVVAASPDQVTLVSDGLAGVFKVRQVGDRIHVDGPDESASFTVVPRFADPADQVAAGSLLAPVPGVVIEVAKQVGAEAATGEVVVVLEAMKMQHAIKAPTDGMVTALPVAVGTQVAAGEVLAVIEEGETK